MDIPLCITSCFSLAVFKILSLIFNNLIIMCLGCGSLCSSCLGVWPSWTLMSVSFARFGRFLALISSNRVSIPLPLFSFWDPIIRCQYSWCCSRGPLCYPQSLEFFFLFCLPVGWFPLSCLSDCWFILLYHLICFCFPLVYFFHFSCVIL